MREILFRGKNAAYGEWVEGFLVKKVDPLYEGLQMYFILRQDRGRFGMFESGMTWIAVKPETVGQYTGLTDKNGKKIFEGDVLRHCSDYICKLNNGAEVVVYDVHNCSCCHAVYGWGTENVTNGNEGEALRDYAMYVVIGNIHDNPELLEVQHE